MKNRALIALLFLAAAILIIFALMFLAVAVRPVANRNLIPYGSLLKVAYCSVVFFYWFTAGLPHIWKPFALFDLLFAVAFVMAALALRRIRAQQAS
ncbi:MAG TPA: hypothetical protein P5279_01620 [Anaerohalosphaeraceae bacterium]|jgi:hypothetical protein|nr:hypothetical protein [Anaerohalosphaeraceae bacterium]HRT49167.1 hypothetical protein [Anaerohalosphaeraceae bacterium]HRT87800.1 hypothetical protein [Anaerohalosphaeraceae bacterium]